MEKRKKHQKLATAPCQEPDSNHLLSKEDENQSNGALAAKSTKTGSPPEENFPSLNEQHPQIFQWTYTTQHATEQSSLNLRPSDPSLVSRWQQVAPLQSNSPDHPVQQNQSTLHLAQSTTPFWLPRPQNYHFPAVSVPAPTFQPFTSIATVDGRWQPSTLIGGTASRSQQHLPNLCYHFGPNPGFPGPWDPNSWWANSQQSQPSLNYTFPGAYGYYPSAPPQMPNCSAAFGESSQRGIIRPTAKLSQKHQQLWEAQSVENVQLWSVIGQLQSEIADYTSRLKKLEAEVSSYKPSADEPTAQVIGTGLSGAGSKRGRPKRSVASSVDVSASPNDSHPPARVRNPAASKAQPEAGVLVFDKVALSKLEDRQKTAQSISSTQKDNGEKIPFVITSTSGGNGSNLPMPALHNQIQVHQEGPGIQISGINTHSSLEMKSSGDNAEENKGGSVAPMDLGTNSETGTWEPASVHPEEPQRNISQSFYDNGCVIREAGKLIPGWSFVNEEDAPDEVEDAVVGSGKDENEEEVGDDNVSSGAEEIAQTKDEAGAYPMDLPQCNNW